MKKLFFLLQFLICSVGHTQILAPSAQELNYSFKSTVIANQSDGYNAKQLAELQASYVFGIFSSPELISEFSLNPLDVGGLGAPKANMNVQILSQEAEDGQLVVDYQASGIMIVHNKVANRLLGKRQLDLPLPLRPLDVYDKKCTDPHYDSFGDFWYFYNPFRKGCEYLTQEPVSQPVQLKVRAGVQVKKDLSPRLDLVRGHNGNGDLFSIYVVHGYYESAKDPKDDGRLSFKKYNDYLREKGFQEKSLREQTTWPLSIFTGSIQMKNGKTIQVEIRHALVESGAESRNVYFAKFFKEAVENADVVIYAGHSGLGSNLDIPYLESKAGKFKFPTNKRQIFFFESCSSYSYYLDHFKFEKTKATIDVVTNGLSSYFETGHDLLSVFTDHMLDPGNDQVTWMKILKDMELPLQGGSYLTNVGGL